MKGRNVKYRVLLGLVIVVSLCVSACDILPEPDEPEETQSAQDAPTALPTSKSSAQGAPTATPRSNAQGEPTATPKPPDDLRADAGDYGELKSYRLYAKQTDQESGEVLETTTACVLDPFALHTINQGDDGTVEMIAIDNAMWMHLPGVGWHKTELTAEEMADLEEMLDEDQDLGELPDIPPWPQELAYLPGQVGLPLVEGGLKRAGAETVNGLSCVRYEVISDYSYVTDLPTIGQVSNTVQAKGTIWVADQSGLPPIIVQADLHRTETTVSPATDFVTSTVRIEHQVTEINAPIAIEPPEGAVEMGSGILPDVDDPSLPTGDQDDTAPTAALDDLDSYRLEWSVTVKQEGYEAQSTYLFEWIKEPSTYRLVTDMSGISFEHLWSGDKAWIKPAGSGDWTEISSDEAPDPFDALGGVIDRDEDMIPDGEETVNGIHCNCFIAEATMPYGTSSHRICVADQAGIPPLVIRGLLQMEQQGSTTIMESNLYDINQPITIETPE